ncbi:MAG: cellulose synthase operon protein YhjQ/BcsQ [Gemmatimonadaceae bacterium]
MSVSFSQSADTRNASLVSRSNSQLDAMVRPSANSTRPRLNAGVGVPTLLCASGRGGSGTSLVAALIAVAAAGDGRRVLLVDGDDLVGPHSLLLGANPWAGWQDLRGGRVQVSDVATSVSSSLTLVAGGAPRHAAEGASPTPNSAERRACMRRVSMLGEGHDLVVVDCGARLETLFATVAPQLHERVIAVMAGRDPITLAATFALCKATNHRFTDLMIDVVVNRQDISEATLCFDALDAGVRQFLPNCPLRFAGAVPLDSTLDAVLRAGMPFLDAAAGSPAAHAAHDIARRALSATSPSRLGV